MINASLLSRAFLQVVRMRRMQIVASHDTNLYKKIQSCDLMLNPLNIWMQRTFPFV